MQVKIAFGKYIVWMDSWLVTFRNCNQILSEYAMGKTAIYLFIKNNTKYSGLWLVGNIYDQYIFSV